MNNTVPWICELIASAKFKHKFLKGSNNYRSLRRGKLIYVLTNSWSLIETWYHFSSVQLLSRVRLFATPWTAAWQASLSITNSRSSLKLTSIELVMPSSHLILCPLLLPPIPPSIRVFSNETTLRMRWPKYWSFSFSIISSKKNPRVDLLQNGLIGSPCSPRDPQESSPTPQFKHINSSALSLLHHPTLTSIRDHRKNHSLD